MADETRSELEQTMSYLETTSKSAYREGMNYRLTRRSRFKNFDEIEKEMLVGGHVALSDLFVLEAIADFSFCNIEMIQLALKKKKKDDTEGQLIIPSSAEDSVKRSLLQLCGYGLAREFEYRDDSGRAVNIYCVTDGGVEIIKKQLYYNAKHKEVLLSLNPEEEAMRRIACNYIGQKLSLLEFTERYIPGKNEYVKNYGKCFIYSRIFMKNREGRKYQFIIEPLYFIVNPKFCTEITLQEYMEERLKMLTKLLENYKEEYENKVIFVVENKDSLRKAMKIVIEKFPYLLDGLDNVTKATNDVANVDQLKLPFLSNIYFTSENAVCKSKYLNRAMIQIIEMKDGKIRIQTVKDMFAVKNV